MIDQLFNLIKNQMQENSDQFQEASGQIDDNVYNEAHDVIVNGLQNMDQSQLSALSNAAQNDELDANAPEVNQLAQQFSGNISNKLGINSGLAKTIAIAVIPMILKKLFSGSQSNNNSGGGFSLDGILGNILGGNNNTGPANKNGGGLMDKISGIGAKLGLDKDGDGDVDLNDITKMFK